MFNRFRFIHALGFLLLGIMAISLLTLAQTPTAAGPVMRFTATTANVSGAPDAIRIDVLAWSTDAERDQLVGAWNLTAPAAGARGGAAGGRGGAPGAGGAGGGGGRGARGGDAGRGGAPAAGGAAGGAAPAAAPDAAAPAANPPAAGAAPAGAAAAAGGGRGAADAGAAAGGGGGRGGRGGGGGRGGAGAAADTVRQTPEGALAAALQTAKTVGYLWTSESAGYSLRYAYRLKQADGGERIIFATERRLGAWNNLWKPAGTAAPSDYEFSIIELRLTAKGEGEGKASVTGKAAIDSSVNSIALDGYAALPVVLKDVKRR